MAHNSLEAVELSRLSSHLIALSVLGIFASLLGLAQTPALAPPPPPMLPLQPPSFSAPPLPVPSPHPGVGPGMPEPSRPWALEPPMVPPRLPIGLPSTLPPDVCLELSAGKAAIWVEMDAIAGEDDD